MKKELVTYDIKDILFEISINLNFIQDDEIKGQAIQVPSNITSLKLKTFIENFIGLVEHKAIQLFLHGKELVPGNNNFATLKIYPETSILAIENWEEPNVIKRFQQENYTLGYQLDPSIKDAITF
jgi:hypothetical protein